MVDTDLAIRNSEQFFGGLREFKVDHMERITASILVLSWPIEYSFCMPVMANGVWKDKGKDVEYFYHLIETDFAIRDSEQL